MIFLLGIVTFLRALALGAAAAVAAENVALRHQVLQRSVQRPRLRPRDRILWAWLAKCWSPYIGPGFFGHRFD